MLFAFGHALVGPFGAGAFCPAMVYIPVQRPVLAGKTAHHVARLLRLQHGFVGIPVSHALARVLQMIMTRRRPAVPSRRLVVSLGMHAAGKQQNACRDRKSTRLNSSHVAISYAVFCLK